MIETFARITAPDFMVGIILWNDKVVQVSAKIDYMRGWSERRVLAHCARKGYWVETIGRVWSPVSACAPWQRGRRRLARGVADRRAR